MPSGLSRVDACKPNPAFNKQAYTEGVFPAAECHMCTVQIAMS